MGKILVTGGAGYIGSHVVKLLGEKGKDVLVYDNLSTGFKDAVLFGELIVGDLSDADKLENVFKNNDIDAIMHFAGSIVVPESVSDPLRYYHQNTTQSLKLLELANKYSVNNFIFSSTAAVYGLMKENFATEETETSPINPYGHSKLMVEQFLKDFQYSKPDFNFIALRYFNVSGADIDGKIGQNFPGATHLIKVSCETATGKRDSMQIYGTDYDTEDGTCIRDYIHVQDLAQAHIDALDYLFKNKKSHILNCGYGHGSSVKEVIKVVKEVSGKDFNVKTADRRPGDPAVVVAKSDKIKELLNWKPKFDDLNLIVKTALNWEKHIAKNPIQ